MIGRTLNKRYKVEAELGSGAMGKVFKATDLETYELVAIKMMARHLMDDQVLVKRFVRESQALRRLDHPNIVGFVDAFIEDGVICLAMQYLSGGTLKDIIKAYPAGMPPGLFRRYSTAITSALAAAHQAGIIHRDLKPSNILLNLDKELYLADFGLARFNENSSLTSSQSALGTLLYMPPEAFIDQKNQDHRGDLWSLGVILFEMVTGRLPFGERGAGGYQIIAAVLNHPLPELRDLRPDAPENWVQIIARCLAKDPEARYPSAEAILIDLKSEAFRTYQTGQLRPLVHLMQTELNTETIPLREQATELTNPTLLPGNRRTTQAFAADLAEAPTRYDTSRTTAPLNRQRTLNMMVFGGTFAWLGMITLLFGSFYIAYNTSLEAAEREVDSPVLILLASVGATLFALGALLELPEQRGLARWLMITLVSGAAVVWTSLLAAILTFHFLLGVLGVVLVLALTAAYFGVKF
ncbi:MAG: serine/threonine protein kinase [Anaerolineae bacterium]|nr:serine/threonine protein kinase [Anaerolineae bacterium]